MTALVYLLIGIALLVAVVLPQAIARLPLSTPMVLLGLGVVIGLITPDELQWIDPRTETALIEHIAEVTVLVSLMGVGLALDRPFSWRDRSSWRRWAATWKLLLIAMPLCIAAVFGLGWGLLGLTPAAALLLGAALSPTDPVLASDVQVEGPSTEAAGAGDGDGQGGGTPAEQQDGKHQDGEHQDIDEKDEVRFALTSEAGLNDSLAFPFVHAAVMLAVAGSAGGWIFRWLGWELIGKVAIGLLVGIAVGALLGRVAFRAGPRPLRVAEYGDPLLAIAALALSYGAAEIIGGYGFLAVFCAAITLRSLERNAHYQAKMHGVIERLERLLTLAMLLILGFATARGLLAALDWRGVVVALALVLVIRPAAGLLALSMGRPAPADRDRLPDPLRRSVIRQERAAVAFFGVRGIGSIFYLAWALEEYPFGGAGWLWATVTFTIIVSVVLHGVLATPVMDRLERLRERGGQSCRGRRLA